MRYNNIKIISTFNEYYNHFIYHFICMGLPLTRRHFLQRYCFLGVDPPKNGFYNHARLMGTTQTMSMLLASYVNVIV